MFVSIYTNLKFYLEAGTPFSEKNLKIDSVS